jgi:hypothetical protein
VIIKLPLSVTLPRKTKADKVLYLNLNVYRNTHPHVLSDAKIAYAEIVAKAVPADFQVAQGPLSFHYTVFPGDGRAFDLSNVCSIIDKFVCDPLQDLGVILNDNYKTIRRVTYEFGAIDRADPRCELEIRPLVDSRSLFSGGGA